MITFSGKSQIASFNFSTGDIKVRYTLPQGEYRGFAVSESDSTALFPRFRTANVITSNGGVSKVSTQAEVYRLNIRQFVRKDAHRLIPLQVDEATKATGGSGPGVPNYLHQVVISPDGRKAILPSKKDNIVNGEFRNGVRLTHDSTVRSIVSTIDLTKNAEVFEDQIDFNDLAPARSVLYTPLGNYLFVALQESNKVLVYDAFRGSAGGVVNDVGTAPHGLYLDADRKTLYVNNFLSRNVTVHDISSILDGTDLNANLIASVSTVEKEPLSQDVLDGKKIFYDAASSKMSSQGYISCASCHIDGDSDGTVWDFTQRGESLRRTISLQGRRGNSVAGSKLHWTGNFDEVQDFEKDIRMEFGGSGFMEDQDYQATLDSLGPKKAGRSGDLDKLAAYVNSLSDFNRSPFREKNGCLTPDAQKGKAIFTRLKCASCHGTNPVITDNKLHDVGTIQASSGKGSGRELVGIHTPTLHGLWENTSFYPNGQASKLSDVFVQRTDRSNANYSPAHGGVVQPYEVKQLTDYLVSLDGNNSCDIQ